MDATSIANVASQAGFRGADLVTAVAVALAESQGDPNAECHDCLGVPEWSIGLWQINLNAHPQYASVNLRDPLVNAQAAYALSGGNNFNAWSTFTGGQYQAHLAEARAGVAALGSTPTTPAPTNPTPSPTTPSSPVATAITAVTAPLAGSPIGAWWNDRSPAAQKIILAGAVGTLVLLAVD
jgi:hypothetical protein